MRRTEKYREALKLTKVRGSHGRVYAAMAAAGYAWDSDAKWYQVEEVATGRVNVRLEGTFTDVVAFVQAHGLEAEPRPGRVAWLAYGTAKSGARPGSRKTRADAGR